MPPDTHLATEVHHLAETVKQLHDRDEALSKQRVKTKIEQRAIRLEIGKLVSQVPSAHLAIVAETSGYTEARLRDFAFVHRQWPEGSFPPDATYTTLEELARDEDRFTKVQAGMSKRDAREARGGKVDTPSRWSAAVKAAFVRDSLIDPAVARELALDPQVRATIAEADRAAFLERRAQRDLDPDKKAMRFTAENDDVIRQMNNIRYAINRVLDQVMNDGFTNAKRPEVIQVFGEVTTSLNWLGSFLNSGDKSFEQAFEELLRQEN